MGQDLVIRTLVGLYFLFSDSKFVDDALDGIAGLAAALPTGETTGCSSTINCTQSMWMYDAYGTASFSSD